MTVARKIGIPAPRVIAYGSPPSHNPCATTLMTRVPGVTLGKCHASLSEDDLKRYIERMRSFSSPWGERVCSVSGGSVRGPHIPLGELGPWQDEAAFYLSYLSYAEFVEQSWDSERPFSEVVDTAGRMMSIPHSITFTHGDLLGHNIMIHDRRISSIINWEFAGWYPEYWGYTSMLRTLGMEWWWPKYTSSLSGYVYSKQLEYFRAAWLLAQNSFSWSNTTCHSLGRFLALASPSSAVFVFITVLVSPLSLLF
ncbi:hypothetical protein PHLGIDRAFT_136633 [Phlebiopsis gigantea 11061_1 CR5-6]|uniref:Aminoglycoside phosphotransferase domain-containing protein n=1 Tax=Phlebiopsis gigantea (strain 11061_1 CR5-6) TaxID=745531 RepID=A0A0C3PXI0_PHLG1|nr:hypothetical protein PHLGIDRAFT_136633 [Phlebiopsis gigantea 11061_1 CR5-6]